MSAIREEVTAAVNACVNARDNRSFFDRAAANAGKALRPAYELVSLVGDSLDARAALKKHPAFVGQKRFTNNVAILAVKLTLQPSVDDAAALNLCRDYARVLDHTVKLKLSVEEFVSIFSEGKLKETLRAAREANPRRQSVGKLTNDLTEPTIALVLIGPGSPPIPKSAATLLRYTPLGDRDHTDTSQLEELVLALFEATVPSDD
jgi:hypothetical protein